MVLRSLSPRADARGGDSDDINDVDDADERYADGRTQPIPTHYRI
jgi:hypothetical protein